jgi:hypothetical protein
LDIRPNVIIQRLNSTCALALVQEEAVESHKRKDGRRYESSFSQLPHKPTYPMPVPLINDKGASSSAAEDRRSTSVASDDKLRALRQYHRA